MCSFWNKISKLKKKFCTVHAVVQCRTNRWPHVSGVNWHLVLSEDNKWTGIVKILTKQNKPKIDFKAEERETSKMQLIWCLISNFYLNMFRSSLCPSSGEQDCVLPHMVFCTFCAGCGCVELGRELCALCESYFRTVTFTQCTKLTSQLHTTTASTTSAEHHMR